MIEVFVDPTPEADSEVKICEGEQQKACAVEQRLKNTFSSKFFSFCLDAD